MLFVCLCVVAKRLIRKKDHRGVDDQSNDGKKYLHRPVDTILKPLLFRVFCFFTISPDARTRPLEKRKSHACEVKTDRMGGINRERKKIYQVSILKCIYLVFRVLFFFLFYHLHGRNRRAVGWLGPLESSHLSVHVRKLTHRTERSKQIRRGVIEMIRINERMADFVISFSLSFFPPIRSRPNICH